MAMMRCSECGKDVSDKAETCPHCGAPIKREAVQRVVRKRCPKCGYERTAQDDETTSLEQCPACGVIYGKVVNQKFATHDPEIRKQHKRTAAAPAPDDDETTPGWAYVISVAVFVALTMWIYGSLFGGGHDGGSGASYSAPMERTPEEIADTAIVDCKQRVRPWLKAPSTAEFSWGHQTIQSAGKRWVLSGYLDAQNSFGVPLRKRWACHVDVENGKAVVVRAKILE